MGKISAMTAASSVVAADEFEINKAGATKKVTAQQISDFVKPYKVYVALLNQSGVSAPVATVLQNELSGAVVWTYGGVGQYAGTLASAFTANKTGIFIQPLSGVNETAAGEVTDINQVQVITAENLLAADGKLINTMIEIRVYP